VRQQPDQISDEELVRQTRAGSLASFEELVYRFEGRLYGFLLRCAGNETDARELTQTTLVTAFRSIHLFNPGNSFRTWLFTIGQRKFIDHCRARRPTVELETVPEPSDLEDPSSLLARREACHELWSRIRTLLGPDQFSALWLHYREEMSVKEIAAALRRTQTSVKVLLFRGRQALLKVPGLIRGGSRPKDGQDRVARFNPVTPGWSQPPARPTMASSAE
jgi:RNA polymerase sigma-70 factor, ECF subfamily